MVFYQWLRNFCIKYSNFPDNYVYLIYAKAFLGAVLEETKSLLLGQC